MSVSGKYERHILILKATQRGNTRSKIIAGNTVMVNNTTIILELTPNAKPGCKLS